MCNCFPAAQRALPALWIEPNDSLPANELVAGQPENQTALKAGGTKETDVWATLIFPFVDRLEINSNPPRAAKDQADHSGLN